MNAITIDKQRLIETLATNRSLHKHEFETASAGWLKKATEYLQQRVDDALAGRKIDLRFDLPQPLDHTDDYDRVLLMLDFAVGDTFTLTEQEFAWYVQDEWGWKQNFTQTNSRYA